MAVMKKCSGECGRTLEDTHDNFYYVGRIKYGDALRPECKNCTQKKRRVRFGAKPGRKPAPPSDSKVCTRCGERKPIADFPENGERRRAQCRPCYNKSTSEGQQRSRDKKRPAVPTTASADSGLVTRIIALLDQHDIPGDDVYRRVQRALNERRVWKKTLARREEFE